MNFAQSPGRRWRQGGVCKLRWSQWMVNPHSITWNGWNMLKAYKKWDVYICLPAFSSGDSDLLDLPSTVVHINGAFQGWSPSDLEWFTSDSCHQLHQLGRGWRNDKPRWTWSVPWCQTELGCITCITVHDEHAYSMATWHTTCLTCNTNAARPIATCIALHDITQPCNRGSVCMQCFPSTQVKAAQAGSLIYAAVSGNVWKTWNSYPPKTSLAAVSYLVWPWTVKWGFKWDGSLNVTSQEIALAGLEIVLEFHGGKQSSICLHSTRSLRSIF